MAIEDFTVGQRVRLTEYGRMLFPEHADRVGTVLGHVRSNQSVSVVWSDETTPIRYTARILFIDHNEEPLDPAIAQRFSHVQITRD